MWQLLFWGSVTVILYIYAGYPGLLYIIGKLRKRPDAVLDQDVKPSVCLIISAFNEEKVLRAKIENSLSLQYPADKLSIVVASDGSTDRTVAIVEDFAEYGVRLYSAPRRRGKSAVLNEVITHLTEEIIVFTDANSLFDRDAVSKLARNFADPSIGCVIGKLRYVDREKSSVGKAEGAYWTYEGIISRLESALKSVLVANGSIFAIRRGLFQELYPEVANDFQIPIDIASRGMGVVYEPQAVAMEHATEYWREEFQRKVRIILRGLTGFSVLRYKIRGFRLWQFWSHKLLRWMVGVFLVTAFVADVALLGSAKIYAVLLVGQVLFYLSALIGWGLRNVRKPWRLFNIPFYFTVVNCAAMTGIVKFIMGQRLTVWEKAESTRLTSVTIAQREPSGGRDSKVSEEPKVAKN
jgi:cellulose synthase/poly-beta-1,6-N-acetylglucosamine synthase-like glycosyltransferase